MPSGWYGFDGTMHAGVLIAVRGIARGSDLVLRGERVGLRAREQADVAILHTGLHGDVSGWSRAHSQPWTPVAAGSEDSPYSIGRAGEKAAVFTVVSLVEGAEVLGDALLWGIDLHNRTAHVGLSLLPAARGRGLGVDVVRLLCHYGFAVRGLRRLQVDTLADNAAMIAAATRVGFELEGTLRGSAWVDGRVLDEVVLGLLAAEWTSS
jgi:RimJ/RimL family protein N-acetyltransferase